MGRRPRFPELGDKETFKYLSERLTVSQITELIGCQPDQVYYYGRKFGITAHKTKDSHKLDVLHDYNVVHVLAEHYKPSEISRIVGCCSTAVYSAYRRFDIPTPSDGWLIDDDKRRWLRLARLMLSGEWGGEWIDDIPDCDLEAVIV